MKHNIRIWVASDSSRGVYYTPETNTLDIVEIAQEYGRAKSGEIVDLIEVDGVELEISERKTAYWNGQYCEYRQAEVVYERN